MTPSPLPAEALYLQLSQAYLLSRKIADQALAALRLTPAEYNVLRILQNTPSVNATEIGKRLHATAPSVNALVTQLERKQFIVRSRSTTDSRQQLVDLTKTGIRTVHKASSEIEKVMASLKLNPTLIQLITHLTQFNSTVSSHLLS